MGAIWADALPTEPQARKASLDAMLALADAEDVKLGLVDLDACTWYLPTTKNQRDHAIHLSAFAVEQFKKLRELRVMLKDIDPAGESGKPSPWVFPATDAARPVCIKSFGKQLADRQRQPEQRLTNRSKAATALMLAGGKWTAHDLRRTAGTMMARLGFSTDTINECLNHISADRMARVYIRDRREADQARAFDALGAKLSELTATTTSAANACQRAAD
jgi:integrase